jgi:DNA-binding MarR family transcriptional regulator
MLTMNANQIKPTFSEDERSDLRKLYMALKPFFDLDHPVLPAAYIRAALLVAIDEGQTVSEYAEEAGITPTVMTRNLLDIGELNRQRAPGLGLVKQERDIMDLRKHRAKVTPKGATLMRDVLRALRLLRKG